MESGLDSIAMAVAHLERVQDKDSEKKATLASPEPASSSTPVESNSSNGVTVMTASTTAMPMRFHQGPRVVSADYTTDPPPTWPVVGEGSAPFAPYPQGSFSPSHGVFEISSEPANAVSTTSSSWIASAGSAEISYNPALVVSTPRSDAAVSLTSTTSLPQDNSRAPILMPKAVPEPPTKAVMPEVPLSPSTSSSSSGSNKITRLRNSKPLKDLQAVYDACDLSMVPPGPALDEDLTKITDDDVLCGRGGESNHNAGNIQYRLLVKACQPAYLAARRCDKPRIAAGIVAAVRKVGGRFLKKETPDTWRDVGNGRAREKTSQALREGAPELRHGTTGKDMEVTTTTIASDHTISAKGMKLLSKKKGSPRGSKVSQRGKRPVIDAALVIGNLLASEAAEHVSKKQKRRSSLESLADAASLRPTPHHGVHGVVAPAPVFIATVSGDDDDCCSTSSSCEDHNNAPKKSRGPRIKLLKQRLQDKC